MGENVGKIADRVLAVGFLMAVSAGLTLPGTAAADTGPTLAGDCATTLGAGSGQALTLDAGAPALAVGTGSDSAKDPSLHLDVADAAKALHVSSVPGTSTVAVLCADAQGAVNALSATTQNLLGGAPAPATPSSGSPQPTTPASAAPGGAVTPADLGSVQFVGFPLNATSPLPLVDLSSLIAPAAVAPAEQGAAPPTGTSPGLVTQDSGSAQALPASSTPAKLPLLLAAIALALALAGLTHTWLRRRPF
jgi:hypothetical protein